MLEVFRKDGPFRVLRPFCVLLLEALRGTSVRVDRRTVPLSWFRPDTLSPALANTVATPFFWVAVKRVALRVLLEAVVEARLRAGFLVFEAVVRGGVLFVAFLLAVTAMTCLLYYSVHEHGGIMES